MFCLVVGLVVWLLGWLFGRLVGRSVGRSVGRLVGWSADRSAGRLGRLVGTHTTRLTSTHGHITILRPLERYIGLSASSPHGQLAVRIRNGFVLDCVVSDGCALFAKQLFLFCSWKFLWGRRKGGYKNCPPGMTNGLNLAPLVEVFWLPNT